MMEYTTKSQSFEDFLDLLNQTLAPVFPAVPHTPHGHLTGQIVGLPRSGTTILYQLLARTRVVGYPSNAMAPFWNAPVVGARLQAKLSETKPTLSMRSLAGRTSEPLDPHEFGYFWRSALGHSANTLEPDMTAWPAARLGSTLDAISEAFDAPTIYKNFLALSHGPWMLENLPQVRFLIIERDLTQVASSLLAVRQRIGVPDEAMFGVDPGGSTEGDLPERIATQVRSLERHRRDLIKSSGEKCLVIDYDELCDHPRNTISTILDFLSADSSAADIDSIPETLESSKRSTPSDSFTNQFSSAALEPK
ncbi:sulfotransferase [Janibacter sp. G349]|uniref:sulfotransferase n=1 Tax=Janibacter sp. G349 TaxID=3405424 RepID=UPI003B77E562